MRVLGTLASLGFATAFSAAAQAVPWTNTFTLDDATAPDVSFNAYGIGVALQGANAAVGSLFGDAVDVFDPATGELRYTVGNPTPSVSGSENFGAALAISDRYLVVGASQHAVPGEAETGAVYVYDVRTGALLRSFFGHEEASGTGPKFGSAVAIDGDQLYVGALLDRRVDGRSGSVSRFDVTSGALLDVFENPLAGSARFGSTLAVDQGQLVVGDGGDREVYGTHLFDVESGALLRTFRDPVFAGRTGFFGADVDLEDGVVVIGQGLDGDGESRESNGFAYAFDALSGELLQTFSDPVADGDLPGADAFGSSLQIDDGRVLIGAYLADSNEGSAFLFDIGSGALLFEFEDPDPVASDLFGVVALDGDRALIGAFLDNARGPGAGQAYLYELGVTQPDPNPPTNVSSGNDTPLAPAALALLLVTGCARRRIA